MTSREHAALPFLSYVQMRLSHQSWKALCGRQSAEEEPPSTSVSGGQEDRASERDIRGTAGREASVRLRGTIEGACVPCQPHVPITLVQGALKHAEAQAVPGQIKSEPLGMQSRC